MSHTIGKVTFHNHMKLNIGSMGKFLPFYFKYYYFTPHNIIISEQWTKSVQLNNTIKICWNKKSLKKRKKPMNMTSWKYAITINASLL